jgi:plastocyanin
VTGSLIKRLTVLAAPLAASATLFGAATPAHTVLIEDYAFKPATITVTVGTKVTWTQKDDDPHTVTADDGSFDSKGLGQGDSYDHVFSKAGRYPYHCAAHPFMKGVVVVKEAN